MEKRWIALVLVSDNQKPDEVETLFAFSVVQKLLRVSMNLD